MGEFPLSVRPQRRQGWANRASRAASNFNSNINNLGNNRTSSWGNQASDSASSFNTSIADASAKAMSEYAPNLQTSIRKLGSSGWKPSPQKTPQQGSYGSRVSNQALLDYMASLNFNQLGRSRGKEDYDIHNVDLDIALEKLARLIPDRFNQRGMRNSGPFTRDTGEFERDKLRRRGEMERLFGRQEQDFDLADAQAAQTYYSTIGDDSELAALAAAAQAAALDAGLISGPLRGGSNAARASTAQALKDSNGQGFY